MDNKIVDATLCIKVYVDCPNCDNYIDLLNPDDTSDYDHNEDGCILQQACPDGGWSDEHKDFEVEDVKCTDCGKEFNVKGLNW